MRETRGQSHLRLTRALGALLIALGLIGSLAVAPVLAASIVVNSLADSAADDGFCTLREAITAANTEAASGASAGECLAGSGADQITFSVSGTITLTSALPAIINDLSIEGAGAIAVSGDGNHQVFRVLAEVDLSGITITDGGGLTPVGGGIDNSGTLTLTNSTITGSHAVDEGGGIFNSGSLTITNSTISGNEAFSGGGIHNEGTLTATGSTISGNSVGFGGGGGIVNEGTMTITDSTISGNLAHAAGGGIANAQFAATTITNSTISGNTAGDGGGIQNGPNGTVTITNSTIAENRAGFYGGGVRNLSGNVTITNSTIRGNSAGFNGGGLRNVSGNVTITSSTMSGNSAGGFGGAIVSGSDGAAVAITNSTISGNLAVRGGGGISNTATLSITNATISGNATSGASGGGIEAVGTETLVNAIVAGNTDAIGAADIEATVEMTTTSIIGVPAGMTLADILDPDGLADNGGPTQTIALALVAGNPAIDTGTAAVCAADPVNSVDQRGMPRPAACDIGAYEAQVAVPAPSPSLSPTASPAPLPNTAASSGTNVPPVLVGTLAILSFIAALAVGCTQRGASNSRR